MDSIIAEVVQRTGIPEDKARMAVQVVIGQLEKQLPAPLAAQLRSHLSGGGTGGSGPGDLAKGLGGMFGK
jgi:hypothetical protein